MKQTYLACYTIAAGYNETKIRQVVAGSSPERVADIVRDVVGELPPVEVRTGLFSSHCERPRLVELAVFGPAAYAWKEGDPS